MAAPLLLFCDGASRRNGARAKGDSAAAAVLLDAATEALLVQRAVRLAEGTTNNAAEYEALLMGIRMAAAIRGKKAAVRAFTDSELLCKQFHGECGCKVPALQEMLKELRRSVRMVGSFSLRHVPREQNKAADSLANGALDELDVGKSFTMGPEAKDVRAAEEQHAAAVETVAGTSNAGTCIVLTEATLAAHELATAKRELRMFCCDVHGPFWKRVDAHKPVARCFGVAGTRECSKAKLDPLPRSEERGEGLFHCTTCGQKWADKLAKRGVPQPCPGEAPDGSEGECGTLVEPHKLRPMKSLHARARYHREQRRAYHKALSSTSSVSSADSTWVKVEGEGVGAGAPAARSGGRKHPHRSKHKCALCESGECRRKPPASRPHESSGSTISNASTVSMMSQLSLSYFRMETPPVA